MNLPKIIRLEVSLKDHREVERLKNELESFKKRVEELEELTSDLQRLNNRYQFDLVSQQKINLQLQDYCRESGYHIPKRLFTVWKSTYETSGPRPK